MDAPVFVVGLERHKEKYQTVIQALAEQGIEAQLWQGVDGWQPIQFEPDEKVNHYMSYLGRGTPFSSTELGCFLSHYRLMKHALAQGWERIVVFEDDARLHQDMSKILAEIVELDQSFEYINMMGSLRVRGLPHNIMKDGFYYSIGDNCKLFRPATCHYGTGGYVITRRGLEKLVPSLTPMKREIDMTIADAYVTIGLRGFVISPNIVMPGKYWDSTNIQRTQSNISSELLCKLLKPVLRLHQRRWRVLEQAYLRDCELEADRIIKYHARVQHKSDTSKKQSHLEKAS